MLFRSAMRSFWYHAAVILPLSGSFIEPLVPFNNLAFGTTKSIAIEDRAAAYAYMPRHDLFSFTLTERGNSFPRHFPPCGSFHGSQLPLERIDDGQSAFRVMHPPEMQRRCFFCCWHHILLTIVLAHGHPAYDRARFSSLGAFAAACGPCDIPGW